MIRERTEVGLGRSPEELPCVEDRGGGVTGAGRDGGGVGDQDGVVFQDRKRGEHFQMEGGSTGQSPGMGADMSHW